MLKIKIPRSLIITSFFLSSLLFAGCANDISCFYTPNLDADRVALEDTYWGILEPVNIGSLSYDQLIDRLASEDYFHIGTASFIGPVNEDWCAAMVSLGYRLKAGRIYFSARYHSDRIETGYTKKTVTHDSTATVWGPNGPQNITMSGLGTQNVPYTCTVPQNEYHVYYFKKMRFPYAFGVVVGLPDEEEARKIGTRNAVYIRRVTTGKVGWKNDLFPGDEILEVDGEVANLQNVLSVCEKYNGRKLKIRRGEKELTIIIDGNR